MNKLGLSWAKLKLCLVRIVNEVVIEVKVGPHIILGE